MNGQPTSTPLAGLKKHFFAMRNGIVADALREGGLPHKVIFGLQLPQITEIAGMVGKDAELARQLWADREVRESRLLACWLMPVEILDKEEALTMASNLRSREEADILAFRLLRYAPFAEDLAHQLQDSDDNLTSYLSHALQRNLEAMKG